VSIVEVEVDKMSPPIFFVAVDFNTSVDAKIDNELRPTTIFTDSVHRLQNLEPTNKHHQVISQKCDAGPRYESTYMIKKKTRQTIRPTGIKLTCMRVVGIGQGF